MENSDLIQVFQHEEFGEIHTLLIDGEPYFKAKDVALALGYKDTSRAIRDHVDTEDKKLVDLSRGVNRPPIAGAVSEGWIKNEVMFINESGLYSLIFSSNLPKAKKFKRWVTSEVLPAIRKTGSYTLPKKEKEIATENQPPAFTPETAIKSAKDMATIMQIMKQYFDFPKEIAVLNAIVMIENAYKIDLSYLKDSMPVAEKKNEKMFTPTQLGGLTGKSAQYVNKRLCALGFQKKDFRGGYILTDRGREYGKLVPGESNGHKYYTIKWDYCIKYVI